VRGRPAQCESGRGLAQSKTQAFAGTGWNERELLECASPLALWKRALKEMAGKSQPALAGGGESGRGLPQSKTQAFSVRREIKKPLPVCRKGLESSNLN
jgi:hypothetical protein